MKLNTYLNVSSYKVMEVGLEARQSDSRTCALNLNALLPLPGWSFLDWVFYFPACMVLCVLFLKKKKKAPLSLLFYSKVSWKLMEAPQFLTSISVIETSYAAVSVCLFLFFKIRFQILKKFSITVELVTWHNLLSLYNPFTN